jgi:hypothetical protein
MLSGPLRRSVVITESALLLLLSPLLETSFEAFISIDKSFSFVSLSLDFFLFLGLVTEIIHKVK